MKHLNHVRAQIREITFTVEALCCHNECGRPAQSTVTYPDGRQAELEVYMFATLREGKICRIHEVTQAPDGDALTAPSPTPRNNLTLHGNSA
ncbi:MAG: hypothetical protein ACLTXH_05670 [Enterobacter hormaechei]